jgi:hypothetical protein
MALMRPSILARRALIGTLLGAAAMVSGAACSGSGNATPTPPSVVGGVAVTASQPPNGKLCMSFEQRIWTSDLSLPGSGTFNGGFTKTSDNVGDFTPDSSGYHLKVPMRVDPSKTSCT